MTENHKPVSVPSKLVEALNRLVRNGQKQGWNSAYAEDMDFAREALAAAPQPNPSAVPVVTNEMVERVCLDRWSKSWAATSPAARDALRDEIRRILLVGLNP